MRTLLAFLAILLLVSCPLGAAKDLLIYFVDVEGGQATLIVSPSGQSMLVDGGWPGYNGRDAGRIEAAAKLAGIRQIDYALCTHYDLDHVGGIPPVAERMPVLTFVDHGPNTQTGKSADALSAAYQKALEKGKRLVVKPGDKIPLKGVDVQVLTARGEKITAPLKGAGAPNPACQGVNRKGEDRSENAKSIGFLLTYGKFRFIDMGDLTWDKEMDLMCPNNPVGAVDAYLITHHTANLSNSPSIVHGLKPRAAIANNGVKKGGSPDAWQVIRSSPGIEDVWQLHYSQTGGKENNSPEQFIANMEEPCQGNWIKLAAQSNGAFTLTNSRNRLVKTYQARK